MSLSDRIAPICDLLLGAAYADEQFKDRERVEVHEMLAELLGASVTPELEAQITAFQPATFDVKATAAHFAGDSDEDKHHLLALVAAINDIDDEVDLREDAYLRALCAALGMPASALAGMVVDVEVPQLRSSLAAVRRAPPPPPPKRS